MPIEDDTAFNEAVSGIAKLDLTGKAQISGSRIRESALEPFRFLQEDAQTYISSRRPLMKIVRHSDAGMNTENRARILLTRGQIQNLYLEIARLQAPKSPLSRIHREEQNALAWVLQQKTIMRISAGSVPPATTGRTWLRVMYLQGQQKGMRPAQLRRVIALRQR